MITEWNRRCDTANCIETRTNGDMVEIRDSADETKVLAVPAASWEEFLAAVRAGK